MARRLIPEETPSAERRLEALTFDARQFAWYANRLALLLVASSFALQVLILVAGIENGRGLVPVLLQLLHVDYETNLPTLYSVLLLLLAAWVSALNLSAAHPGERRLAIAWGVLASVFVFLAVDEFMSLHETLNQPGRRLLAHLGFAPTPFAWVVVVIPVLVPVAVCFLSFLLKLEKDIRHGLIGAGLVYVGGAVVLETLSGIVNSRVGYRHLAYQVICHGEELAEMMGVILFITVSLRHLARRAAVLRISLPT